MLKRRVYDDQMQGHMLKCCNRRTWQGWSLNGDVLVPDVSRVIRRHIDDVDGVTVVDERIEMLFHRKRIYSKYVYFVLNSSGLCVF